MRRDGRRRMRLRDGSLWQRLLFGLLLGVPALGISLAAIDRVQRLGEPNIGWMMDGRYVSPTRADASAAGLRGGGRALRVNGVEVPAEGDVETWRLPIDTAIGATNTIAIETAAGNVREVTLAVQPWRNHDFFFTQGATDIIGLVFIVVGVASFMLRPYDASSWALLALGCASGTAMLLMFLPTDPSHPLTSAFFLGLVGFVVFAPTHVALAFPVVHPLLRRRATLWLIYGAATLLAAFNVLAGGFGYLGPLAISRGLASVVMLAAIVYFGARCLRLAIHSEDPVVTQRARIILGGAAAGLAPYVVVEFAQSVLGALPIDRRFTVWPLALFIAAMARITVRPELLNARIAVRRAVLYSGAVVILTVVALVLIAFRPYAVAVLLFPLLYIWPRFDARLNRRLYPQRARFPALLRALGGELAGCESVGAVLEVLARQPERLCDARTAVAFLLDGDGGSGEHVRGADPARLAAGGPLGDELLVQLLRTTRSEVRRADVAVQPQYANIKNECYAGFNRLRADLLLPMVHEQRVIGALAVGPRASGDVYERAEIDALSTAAQQAVQAIIRVEANERLRAREREFGDLKRFFPPQIIEQVMARGGAAELRSQRKVVTVLFADLRGFTSFSDSVEPEEVMATLADYHALMGARIAEFAGTLEHFAGDGFMVFFNDPVDQPDHAERAVRMALAMHADLDRLRDGWRRKGYQIDVGTGIHTGYATCGFIGYEGRRDYAVIGNVSNLAARLSDAAGAGEILVSTRVRAEIGDRYRMDPIGELTLKGFHQPQLVYRLLGEPVAARNAG